MNSTAHKQRSQVWAILPVKSIGAAKQRLSGALSARERRDLFRHMLADVLAAVRDTKSLDRLLVVTRDPEVKALAEHHRARIFSTDADDGQSAAVNAAARMLSDEGVRRVITLPGDVPLVTAAEIDAVCDSLETVAAMTIVPNSDETGSNSIACSPPCAIRFMFGEMSFPRHLREAEQREIATRVLRLAGLSLDIDVVSDLVELLRREATTATQRFLLSSGIASRLEQHGRVAHRATGADGLAIQ